MNTREFSKNQENKVAKELDGKVVANSGATKFNKGDVVVDNLMLIECKTTTTEKQNFTIKKEWLEKNDKERFSTGTDYSALAFDFGSKKTYYVIDTELMLELLTHLKSVKNER